MLTAQQMVEARRYCIVAVFVVAALLTPPSAVAQLSLALPLLAAYEAVIALLRWLEGRS